VLHHISSITRLLPIAILIILCIFFLFKREEHIDIEEDSYTEDVLFADGIEEVELPNEEVIVDVKGEVKMPGVYSVPAMERVHKVIELAGGFTAEAAESEINLAQKVHDEMVIYVPKEGEENIIPFASVTANQTSSSTTSSEELVRVNIATVDELTTLQGIGPAKAQAIIDYREEYGPFQVVEDLLEVSGIGEKTLENIKDSIIIP